MRGTCVQSATSRRAAILTAVNGTKEIRRESMSAFTPAEIEYLRSQRLGRLATAGPDGQPHVVPVGFRYNPDEDTVDIGGSNVAGTKKWRDVGRNPRVAFVVDDLASVDPWRVRGIEIRGAAEPLASGDNTIMPGFAGEIIRLRPRRIVSWGIEEDDPFARHARSVG
jgi:pyridoxamine 5'-phosphate oxidase family protein